MSKEQKPQLETDDLLQTEPQSIELEEQDLDRVSGGIKLEYKE